MLRSALLISAGIVAALVVACVPPQPPAAPPPTSEALVPVAAVPRSVLVCDASAFLNKVWHLDTNFMPYKNAPLPVNPPHAGANYLTPLGQAYCQAPQGFQQVLDNDIDAVYINDGGCPAGSTCFDVSWGWLRRSGNQRIVALSAALFTYNYEGYETALMQSILPQDVTNPPNFAYTNSQSCNTAGVCTQVNTVATALLAALAHEIGHIRWYDHANANPGSYCSPSFLAYSWLRPYHRPPGSAAAGFWRELLTAGNRSYLRSQHDYLDRHRYGLQIDDIDYPPIGAPTPNQQIYQLLASAQPWASLFAAMSPDEDFVETYKFRVLTDTTVSPGRIPLTGATIVVPDGVSAGNDGVAYIIRDYKNSSKASLSAKVGCITSY